MKVIADLQLHSRFARAVSKEMTILKIAEWSRKKGIGLVATGDWTHPLWFREIEQNLEEIGNGLLRLKGFAQGGENFFDPLLARRGSAHQQNVSTVQGNSDFPGVELGKRSSKISSPFAYQPLFLLATEVSCIYSQGGRGRRIHTLIWVPTLSSARKISQEMTKRGCNLLSDGRPIIGLTSIEVAELVLTIEKDALIIPAHGWTPWFAVFGAKSGFDSLEEAFGPYAKYIYAVETGLSSDPAMNWRIQELDHRAILSFSDAHSGPKLGREATVFEIDEHVMAERDEHLISYQDIHDAIVKPSGNARIAYTIEFYPEEGKYHYTGHRACNIRLTPDEARHKGMTCSVCGKLLTQGVMQRVEELASRSEEDLRVSVFDAQITDGGAEVRMTKSLAFPDRPPYVMLVPLQEILAQAVGSPVASPKVQGPYHALVDALGGEFRVLLEVKKEKLAEVSSERIAEAIEKVRRRDIHIDPGYDGVFGVVKIWKKEAEKSLIDTSKEQLTIF
ncbi:MAG: endonuclease Q family protein [bacterium]|nr:endonuclease Q family protein [bacterium]